MDKTRADRAGEKSDGDEPAQRGRTIDKVEWWCATATRKADELGFSNGRLAQLVTTPSFTATEWMVVRCLNGSVLNLKLAQAISAVLAIAPPAFIPATEEEAMAIVAAIELHRVRVQLGVMQAGVGKASPPRQPDPLPSVDGTPRRKRRRARRPGP